MQNKRFNVTVALTNVLTTNVLNPAVTSMAGPVGITIGQPYLIVDKVRIINKTAGAVTFTFYKGATGANVAGTEVLGVGRSVAANSEVDIYGKFRLDSGDFLVGGASAATSLVAQFEGEVGISG